MTGNDISLSQDADHPAGVESVTGELLRLIDRKPNAAVFLKGCCDVILRGAYPDVVAVRIRHESGEFRSSTARDEATVIQGRFRVPDETEGTVELALQSPDPAHAERQQQISGLFPQWISVIKCGLSVTGLRELRHHYQERQKELAGILRVNKILNKGWPMTRALEEICQHLPAAWQYPKYTAVRISFEGRVFLSEGFRETEWSQSQVFRTPDRKKGQIDVFYLKGFPAADEGPFLKEERNLLINVANLIAGHAARDRFGRIKRINVERVKELNAINQTSRIIDEGNNVHETLQRICNILPLSWQYPKFTACRIEFEGRVYSTPNFRETEWMQKENIQTVDKNKGTIEIAYLKEFPVEYDGPFLMEERNLLINIAKLVSGYLNSCKGLEIITRKGVAPGEDHHKYDEFKESLIKNRKPLQLYFNQQSIEKYVYLDMMRYKVKHILFVSTLYDAFMLESEDTFFERFMGIIYQYSLFSLPRITGVSSAEEALELLETTRFDLVILMVGLDRKAPVVTSERIREKHAEIPIYLLLNKKTDVKYFEGLVPSLRSVDELFVWNGDSRVLFAIVKSIEDRVNVENDTRIGLVRVILLIEDSPFYYSKYLQILYSIVFDQVQQILPEVEKNELDKISKMRSRPKVLLARNYEEALSIFNKFKDHMLCVISDAEFERAGKVDKEAGAKFITYARSRIHNLPVVLQSSEERNAEVAHSLGISFVNKNSETLLEDLKRFLVKHLGFGPFVFRDEDGKKVAVARSLREFETSLRRIPDSCFYNHAIDNQFSLWLMARGEIQLAKTINSIQVKDMEHVAESREVLIEAIQNYKREKKRGKIMSFDETGTLDEENIVSFSRGSLGGKGRGLAFIDVLIYNLDFSGLNSRINISTPITVVIGTDEFQSFIARNKLMEKVVDPDVSYAELRRCFHEASLSNSLMYKLKVFLSQVDKPIAVRSSSTSEDSITQPFSGVFDTYVIPNCHANKRRVLELLSNAIKLIFASVYSDDARSYFEAINHRIEDERMAVILQELVGSYHGDYYYPHISGVAQSHNYYPVADMKPEEGFAVAAVGLGSYVVNGWKSYRFSPTYPRASVYSTRDLLNSTQVKFYALKCNDLSCDLLQDGELASLELLDIAVAEKHGTLKHCASVYDVDNDRVEAGLDARGPRIIDFASILQYDYIPLAQTLNVILRDVEEALGSPVEIEYAVDLDRGKNNLPTFYLLQIKPLVTGLNTQTVSLDRIDRSALVLYTQSSLGNGDIESITDVIYADPIRFSKLETVEMASEIEKLNRQMTREGRHYVLIAPGRWGTRDQFLGVPVNWAQISHAKVIVETSLENFPLDSSLGSHFFHNVTSMNIGYFSVKHNSPTDKIRWDILEHQELVSETRHFRHVRFPKPLRIMMDGRKRRAAILMEQKPAIPTTLHLEEPAGGD